MIERIFAPLCRWAHSPTADDPFTALRIHFINVYVLVNFGIILAIFPAILIFSPESLQRTVALVSIFLAGAVVARLLLTRVSQRAAEAFIMGHLLLMGCALLLEIGLDSRGAALIFTVLLLLAGMLTRSRQTMLLTGCTIAATYLAAFAAARGWGPPYSNPMSPWTVAALHSVTFAVVSIFTYLFVSGMRSALERSQDELRRRERAEKIAQAGEQRYQTLIDQAQGMVVVTLSLDGMLLSANAGFEAALGWKPRRWLKTPVEALIHPGDRRTALKLFEELKARGTIGPFAELRLLHRDGRTIQVELSASIVDDSEEGSVVLIIARDTTERKQAESLMQQAQKLDSLGLLAGGIAHDFNNLLVGVLGQTSLALRTLPPESPSHVPLSKAVATAERAADVTRQLLAYSGRGQFEMGPVDLNALIEDNLQLLSVAVSKHIDLHTSLAEDLPPIEADRGQMQQVLMNLILNAAQAIGDARGSIAITTREQRITAADTHFWNYTGQPLSRRSYVLLEVSDTGAGMSAHTLQQIFDPFYSTKQGGSGLGLAAVLGIVRGHHGGIYVSSEPLRGTTFELLFPMSPDPLPETAVFHPPQLAVAGTLLVIDDEAPVREAITDMLRAEGMTVMAANSGYDGLRVLRECGEQIDLVLLDLTMPGMSGEETFYAIRALDADVPIIISSGYSEQTVRRRFPHSELAGFLQKPYTVDTLLAKLHEYL